MASAKVGNSAGLLDIIIEQGVDKTITITQSSGGSPVDVTGYSARAQFRVKPGADLLLDLTSSNGGITVGTTDGTFKLNFTDTATSALAIQGGQWDLETVDTGGAVVRLLEGRYSVSAEISI